MYALMALACGAMMTACCGSSDEPKADEDTLVEVVATEDMAEEAAVKYYDNENEAVMLIANDKVVELEFNGEVKENLEATVLYGEERPAELGELEEGATLFHGQVVDRMYHGDNTTCWVVVKL